VACVAGEFQRLGIRNLSVGGYTGLLRLGGLGGELTARLRCRSGVCPSVHETLEWRSDWSCTGGETLVGVLDSAVPTTRRDWIDDFAGEQGNGWLRLSVTLRSLFVPDTRPLVSVVDLLDPTPAEMESPAGLLRERDIV